MILEQRHPLCSQNWKQVLSKSLKNDDVVDVDLLLLFFGAFMVIAAKAEVREKNDSVPTTFNLFL